MAQNALATRLKKPVYFGLLLLLALASCDMSKEKEKVDKMLSDTLASELTENVVMRFSDSGYLKAVLSAPILERFRTEEPYSLFPEGVIGKFYNKAGELDNSMRSDYAISYDDKKIVELKKDVELVNVKGEKLNTEKLIWDQNTGMIHTEEFVKITTADNIIFGEGLEATQDFSEYRIFKVKGEISLNEETEP